MTAIALTPNQRAAALSVAKEIGTAFGQARTSAGHTKKAVAEVLAMHQTTVAYFEQGHFPNVKLGNAIRLLRFYGLTLAVVPQRGVPK